MTERNEDELKDNKVSNEENERELGDDEQNHISAEETNDLADAEADSVNAAGPTNPEALIAPVPVAPVKKSSGVIVPWVVAAIAVAALVFVLVRSPSNDLNKTIGKMDGATFTKVDLFEAMTKQMGEGQQESLLDSIMTNELIDLEAKKEGIVIADADIKAEIEEIKKQNNIPSDDDLSAALQQSGRTLEDFKEQIGRQLKFSKIFEKQNAVTDGDLKAYYEKNKENFATTPKQVQASHILLATKEEAEAVLKELKAGKDFATLAKEKSIDPGSKDQGGALGPYFTRGEMNQGFEEGAFSLAKGETSEVVEAESGFHIIKVTDIKEAVVPPYEEVKDKVKQAYYDEKLQNDGMTWMEKAKKDRNYKNLLAKKPEPTPSPAAAK
ncbi:peptidylprolyl isomerase [Cohnella abietis]|uniref:peptidylprolyl isomerase n=1 Tax=Cohnella abietis TaxID=2507935 RepID=A0A3T1D4S2_9BACL|nr:peptidylprolyl isomerase [Cohnella abietis]BBI33097.1 hypothetical protein KCTCHS21_24960 [Cohnella abietis]